MRDKLRQNIESVLLSYYVKYDIMLPMINTVFDGSKSDTVDIYIDLYNYFRAVYEFDVYANKKLLVVSYVINLVAHYRNYFRTRHSVKTRIFLVYSDRSSMNQKQFIPNFGDDAFRQELDYGGKLSYVDSQLELVKYLAAYINDVYYIRRKSEFLMFTYDNMLKNPDRPAVLLTRSKYAYQLTGFFPYAMVLRPCKNKTDGDVSYYICGANANLQYCRNITNAKTIEGLMKISPKLLSVLMTMIGLPKYKVNAVVNATQAVKMLNKAIDEYKIVNDYNTDIKYLYDNLDNISKYIDPVTFEFRFKAMDMIYQHGIYLNTPESMDNQWNINLYDPQSLKELNDKYFYDNPLDLEVL